MCHIAELVIGGCVLIAMTTLGVVAILGVLGCWSAFPVS